MKRIAIVEDVPSIQELYKYALEPVRADVRTYSSAGEAIKHVGLFQPDLLILDHRLTDTIGYFVLEQVPFLQQIPVILISGYLDPQIIPRYQELGVKTILSKPIDIEVFVNYVKQYLYADESGTLN